MPDEKSLPEIYRHQKGASLDHAGLGPRLPQENINNIPASDSGYDLSAPSAFLTDIGYDAGTPTDIGYDAGTPTDIGYDAGTPIGSGYDGNNS